MKKIVIIYGVIAGVINLAVSYLIFVVFGEAFEHAQNQVMGYLVMVIALSIIFVAIKQYRDKNLGGIIKFKTAFLLGLYISLIAGTIYVANWEIYMQSAGSNEFIESYQSSILESMKEKGASESEIQEQVEKNMYYKEMYSNTFYRVLITYSEILPVGLIISLLSAFLLKNPKLAPQE